MTEATNHTEVAPKDREGCRQGAERCHCRTVVGLEWLSDPADARTVEALGRRCDVCAAPPGELCRPPIGARLIHHSRYNQKLDKRGKRG